jgi:lipopolysaccharide export system permease protein
MQFLWKYVDDLVGKGLEWYIIGELLFYASATFVPLALPLAILLSSIMSIGSLGENYELTALKSAGISLVRIMWPLVIISLFFVMAAFYFSNNVLPIANLKMGSLLYDVRQQRPTFNIMEGVYYKGIDNYVIRVEEKGGDGNILKRIKIYDHSQRRGNTNITTAEWGTMKMTDDEMFLVLTLYNGYNYEEVEPSDSKDRSRPFQRTYFEERVSKFDLSGFALARTDEELFRSNFRMLNINQLLHFEDSLKNIINVKEQEFIENNSYKLHFYKSIDSLARPVMNMPDSAVMLNLFDSVPYHKKKFIIDHSMDIVRQLKEGALFAHEDIIMRRKSLARYQIEFHRKFTLSFACLILFMIGAPLGAIIRKGGFGLPVVVSVLFFVFFHVMSITGEKFVREGVIDAWQGMWIASLILLPVAVLLTVQATTDSALMDMDSYIARIGRIKASRIFPSKKITKENENTSVNQ